MNQLVWAFRCLAQPVQFPWARFDQCRQVGVTGGQDTVFEADAHCRTAVVIAIGNDVHSIS
jgi:hypothetical protein